MRILLLALLSLAACGDGDSGKLKVGIILPMTGDTATYGEESWNGIQLAYEDLQEKEGIDWELVLKDDKSESMTAGNQAKLLIENEGADVLIGSVASGNTKLIARFAREAGVPLITPASTNDQLTLDGGPLVSRICFKDSFQGAVLANFALQKGWKKAVVVVDKAQVYSTGLADNFKEVFEDGGGTVTFEYYTTQDTDFANTVQNVANANPEVIFISGYYNQAGPMIRQSKGKWDGVPILGGDGWDSPKTVALVGDTNAEIYISTHFASDAPDERVQDFARRYQERFGQAPGAMAALGYDVMIVLADAVKRCENPHDPEQLGAAIAATTGVQAITGKIDLTTPDRTPIKDAVIAKVEGKIAYHATIPAN